MKRLAPMLGFGIKIVERAGRTLRSQFPLSSLWDGAPCGRMECVTCTQGADKIPPCTRKSLVYENICKECNQGAGGKEEVKNNVDTPSIYVGETSRTIKERGEEHWGAAKCRSEKSHMFKHRELHHGGQEAAFILQPISFHKSALSRQIAEAVRIRRRGGEGAILNSKAEFSRCRIPRLQLEKEEENEDLIAKEQERMEQRENEMEQELLTWEKEHVKRKSRELKEGIHLSSSHVRAREQEEKDGKIPKRMRKLKYSVIGEEWGDPEGAELNLLEEEESTLLPKEALLRNKQCSITEYLSKKNENAATPPMKRKRKPSNEENQAKNQNQASKPNSPKKPSNPSVPNPVKIQEGASPAQVYPSVGNLGEGCLGGTPGGGVSSKSPLTQNEGPKPNPGKSEDEFTGGSRKANNTELNEQTDKCDLDMNMKTCNTHGCKLSETKVTSTKWEYIERKKCYGNVRRKVTRWICRGKNNRLTVHTISTSARSTDSRVTRGQISESSGDLHNLLEKNNETG